MEDSASKKLIETKKDTTPAVVNPALLVKTPGLPVKTEFSENQSKQKHSEQGKNQGTGDSSPD